MISVILPAKNEAAALAGVLARIRATVPGAEIVVVDDGSTDDTAAVARAAGARVHSHPVSLGNGAAIKSGARVASGDTLVFLDADGQHPPEAIPALLAKLEQGYEMGRPSQIALTLVVGRGKLETVRIGGQAVRVASGTLEV